MQAKDYKPINSENIRTVMLPVEAKWGLTVNGQHVDLYNTNDFKVVTEPNDKTVLFKLTTQAILDASPYAYHYYENGKSKLNDHGRSPALVDSNNYKRNLHHALSSLGLLKPMRSNERTNKSSENKKCKKE